MAVPFSRRLFTVDEYHWIVDVGRDHVAVYLGPTADGYLTTRVHRRGETISPAAFPALEIAVSAMLG